MLKSVNIHEFNQGLLIASYGLSTVLGTENITVNKTNVCLPL